MKDEELMRRISDALDAPGGLDADADLRVLLDADEEASLYAADLQSIDSALAGLGPGRAESDWDALFQSIELGLDGELDALEDIGDPTLAPVFLDEEVAEPSALTPEILPAAVVSAAANNAQVLSLSAARQKRQRLFATIGGLAAAAAVGLGIIVGLDSSGSEAPMASAPVLQEAEQAEMAAPASAPAPLMVEPSAEAEAPAEMAMADEAPAQVEPSPIGAVARSAARSRGDFDRAGGRRLEASPMASRRRTGGGSATAGGGGAGPGNPTRVQVVNALNSVAPAVQRCIGETGELARVHVRVNGSTGRIESATVAAPYTGTEARCVVRAVRSAHMPTSQHPTYEVDHAYHPAPIAGGSLRPGMPAARRTRRARPASPGASAPANDVLNTWGD